ncbi:hypothetical protein VaNZ11_005926 [Volvox africanus]|uniref:Uncharacterized protein n=1 Tax=Volvox africanus TaxID=51714 RepID=A0ABQ5S0I5_9CHLO|nr:hypothetical protein VaNZ11_005926 [Volvox africanus]
MFATTVPRRCSSAIVTKTSSVPFCAVVSTRPCSLPALKASFNTAAEFLKAKKDLTDAGVGHEHADAMLRNFLPWSMNVATKKDVDDAVEKLKLWLVAAAAVAVAFGAGGDSLLGKVLAAVVKIL